MLLHQGLGSISMWRDVPAALAQRTGRDVVAYSRRGYGRSSPIAAPREPDYMHHEGEVVLPALLDALDIDRAILYGHSDGGSIAVIAAATHPDRVEALILEAAHVFVEDLSVRSIAAAREAYATTDLRAKLARHHDDVDGAFRGWNDIWLDPRFRSWNIEAYADRVRCPALVIQGANDEFGTLAQVESVTARIAQAQTLVVPGAAHSVHRDDWPAVQTAITSFTAKL